MTDGGRTVLNVAAAPGEGVVWQDRSALQDGTIEGRPGDDDPGAIALLRKLSRVSRKRWPETAVEAPRLMPPPKPKPPQPEPAAAPAPA